MENNQTPEQQAGQRIKARRDELHLSQSEVAKEMSRLGHSWHQSTVFKTEAADRPIRINEVIDLAAVLDTSVWDLLGTPRYSSTSVLRQLMRAEEDVERLEGRVKDLELELFAAKEHLRDAQLIEANARNRLEIERQAASA